MDPSSDESEDWFIESLHMYKDLHVIQLEHPTKVIEWTGEKSICVAGYSSAKSEILELLLPLKLYAKGNKGLCPERDFKVLHGGFSDEPVECLCHVGNRCLVTSSQHSSKLQVWDVGGDQTDVIKRTGVINCSSTSATSRKLAAGLTGDASVLHGSVIGDVQLTEVGSGKVRYAVGTGPEDTASGLRFINADAFIICSTGGTLYTGDTREPKIKHHTLEEPADGSRWVFGLKTDGITDSSSCSVARLSCTGTIMVSDMRNLSEPLTRAQLKLQDTGTGGDFLSVTWAPELDNHLAVSGFDGHVRVFDTASWTPESQPPEPVFTHRGHEMSREETMSAAPLVVTAHVWHPRRPRTLLSSASDGSVHVWDWVNDQNQDTD